MKKAHILIFLTAQTFSALGMEKDSLSQPFSWYNSQHSFQDYTEIPMDNLSPIQFNTSVQYTDSPYHQQPTLSNPYQSVVYIPVNTTQTLPNYYPVQTNVTDSIINFTQQQYKTTITKTIIQPDLVSQEKLYQQIVESLKETNNNEKLIAAINAMKNGQKRGITEDAMGKFAFNKSDILTNKPKMAALFFSCLKNYFITAATTKESVPLNTDALVCYNAVSKALGITPENIDPYPSYQQLFRNINQLQKSRWAVVELLSKCLYSKPQAIFKSSSKQRDFSADITAEFYNKVYSMLYAEKNTKEEFFDVIQLVNQALEKGTIKTENHLKQNVMNFDPKQTVFDQMWNSYDPEYLSSQTKKRIYIFCELIKEYNEKRGDKTTPTGRQVVTYELKKNIPFVLPDFFDSSLFCNESYAFTEFEQLENTFCALATTTDKNMIEAQFKILNPTFDTKDINVLDNRVLETIHNTSKSEYNTGNKQ